MVEYIKINGKEYPVRISYYVMSKIRDKHDMELEDALDEAANNVSIHEDILFFALQAGAHHEHGSIDKLDLTKDDMMFALDGCFWDYMDLFSSEKFFPQAKRNQIEKMQNQQQNGKKLTRRSKKKQT